ncbi:MAG: hypothetical protein ACR2NU_16050 [Aeoliella sp.]
MDARSVLRLLLVVISSTAACQAAEPTILAANGDLQWRRGNMHTHSHWSDGDDYLESIALWYRDRGYDFLVFTDHNVLATTERWVRVDDSKGGQTAYNKLKQQFPDWIDERKEGDDLEVRLRRFDEVAQRFNKPGEFLLIQGEEISDQALGKPVHLNVGNVKHLIEPQGGRDVFETIDNNVRAALAQRKETGQPMIVHLNHPNFGFAVTAEDLLRVRGERFFEVYNGHPDVANQGDELHPGTERMWDIILAQRIATLGLPMMFGLAVDDGHEYHHIPSRRSEPGRGWVMVLSHKLTSGALIESLEEGRFYASSGVSIKRIESDAKRLAIEVEPEAGESYTIEFVGTKKTTDLKGEPITDEEGEPLPVTHRYSDGIGEVLKKVSGASGEYTFKGDELYVRARITSSAAHPNPSDPGDAKTAWVQPVLGPAAPVER